MTVNARLVYVTVETYSEAINIGRSVVTARLAACANVLNHVKSIYWWDGDIQESDEIVLLLKSRSSLIEPLIEKVRAVHSYDCPCIVVLPIEGGNPQYLEWIVEETTTAPALE